MRSACSTSGESNASSSQKSWPERAGQAAASLELERALHVEAKQRAVRAEAEAERAKAEADRDRRRRIDVETQLAYANVRVDELDTPSRQQAETLMKSCFSSTTAKKNRERIFGMMMLSSAQKFNKSGANKQCFINICARKASIIEKICFFFNNSHASTSNAFLHRLFYIKNIFS